VRSHSSKPSRGVIIADEFVEPENDISEDEIDESLGSFA